MTVSCLVFFRILIPYLDTNGIYITKNAIKWNKECYKTKMEKLQTKVGDGNYQKGPLSHF